MTDIVAQVAREVASRLEQGAPLALSGGVEAALASRDGRTRQPDQYGDLVSLGGFLVSVATLAWTVYNDRRSSAVVPAKDVLVRAVKLKVEVVDDVDPGLQARVIDLSVEEVIRASRQPDNAPATGGGS